LQLSTPLPYSPPKTNAAFFSSGMTATHRARSQYCCGILVRISSITRAAAASRAASLAVMAAPALAAVASTTTAAQTYLFMSHLVNPEPVQDRHQLGYTGFDCSRRMMRPLACALALSAVLFETPPAGAQYTPFHHDSKLLLEGNWQSCFDERTGQFEEKIYDQPQLDLEVHLR